MRANSLAAFAHGLAVVNASDTDTTVRSVTRGCAELVYSQGRVGDQLANLIKHFPE